MKKFINKLNKMIFEPFGSPEDFKMMEDFIKNKTEEEEIIKYDFVRSSDISAAMTRNIIFNFNEHTISKLDNDPYFTLCCRLYSFDPNYSSQINTNCYAYNILETIGFHSWDSINRDFHYLNDFNSKNNSPVIKARIKYHLQEKKFDLNQHNSSKFIIGCYRYSSTIISLHGKVFNDIKDVIHFFQTDSDVEYYHSDNLPDYDKNFEWWDDPFKTRPGCNLINCYENHGLIKTLGGYSFSF